MYRIISRSIAQYDSNGNIVHEESNTKVDVTYDFRKDASAEIKKKGSAGLRKRLHALKPDYTLSVYLSEQGFEWIGVVKEEKGSMKARFKGKEDVGDIELLCYGPSDDFLLLNIKGKGYHPDVLNLKKLQQFVLKGFARSIESVEADAND